MHRKFLLALAACLPLALSGCGGGGGTPASSTASPSGTTGGAPASFQAAVAEFEAARTISNARLPVARAANATAADIAAARAALVETVEAARAAIAAGERAPGDVSSTLENLRTALTVTQRFITEMDGLASSRSPSSPSSPSSADFPDWLVSPSNLANAQAAIGGALNWNTAKMKAELNIAHDRNAHHIQVSLPYDDDTFNAYVGSDSLPFFACCAPPPRC